jgi:hypothetical protein
MQYKRGDNRIMPKWEYKVVYVYRSESGRKFLSDSEATEIDFSKNINLLNFYGQSGWELVIVTERDITPAESFILDAKQLYIPENIVSVKEFYFKRVINY